MLGIDTSCDETSLALLDMKSGTVVVNLVSSQVELHAVYGGVVPELASRAHGENLSLLFHEALARSGAALQDIAGVAVTHTPGLIGCLLVGTSFAKALAYRLNVPLYAVNHLDAHLFSPFIGMEPMFPFLGLVVSGGHTAFYNVSSWDDIKLIGQTVDDAAGEAFDKGAKLMGLGYPGGPLVDELARDGDASAYPFTIPKVKMGVQYLSFSGIKTALHHHLQKISSLDEIKKRDLCASLQRAIVTALTQKARHFLAEENYDAFAVSGGVAMNSLLRGKVAELARDTDIGCVIAKPEYCTDNAAMVAYLARHRLPEEDYFSLGTTPSRKIQARQLPRQNREPSNH